MSVSVLIVETEITGSVGNVITWRKNEMREWKTEKVVRKLTVRSRFLESWHWFKTGIDFIRMAFEMLLTGEEVFYEVVFPRKRKKRG